MELTAPDPDALDRLEQAFVEMEERFKKLPRPPTDRIDMLQYCIGAVRDARHASQAQPIDANTPPPLERRLLLWFVGRDAPKAAHCWTIGTVSAHQTGEVWIDGDYRPIEWFSHWRELPPHPRCP
jgi:hypothetical protein